MLLGVDLTHQSSLPSACTAVAQAVEPPRAATSEIVCLYADCAQSNASGALRCVYCDRPLDRKASASGNTGSSALSVLPSALSRAYRLLRDLPTQGAEADLFVIEPLLGGEQRVAKIYRLGLERNRAVAQRIAQIDARFSLTMFEAGSSDGRAYEVFEFCPLGSLRNMLNGERIAADLVVSLIEQLDAAIASVHAVKLVHRDIKPENILLRGLTPLQLVLIDFNIASVLDATQRFTGMARTLHYSAPEALSGVIDGKTDYWAMGMVVLEACLGRHPFAGLSEAVILHQLTTRSVDLSEIDDKVLRKLLRGLLLRDPNLRWGHEETLRWLAGDVSLAEPFDESVSANFEEPYHLGGEVCRSPVQLAVALSHHWREGVGDLNNGQLLSWFSKVQKDQDTVRLLLDFQQDAQLHGDIRLLRLLLHLYPSLPPIWRGESIGLPAILLRANASLAGDESASRWLEDLYQRAVLHIYAAAGNPEAQSIEVHWGGAMTRFETAWESSLATLKLAARPTEIDRAHSIDAAIYGQETEIRADYRTLHAKLIASSYDDAWISNLRERLILVLAQAVIHSPGLIALGDPTSLDAPTLLVLDELLPRIEAAAQATLASNAAQTQQRHQNLEQMALEARGVIGRLRTGARQLALNPAGCSELRDSLDQYFSLRSRIELEGVSDEKALTVRKTLLRFEPTAHRLLAELDALEEHFAANSGWLDQRVIGFGLLAALFLPAVMSWRILYFVTPIVLIIAAWRLLPIYLIRRRIRGLGSLGSLV